MNPNRCDAAHWWNSRVCGSDRKLHKVSQWLSQTTCVDIQNSFDFANAETRYSGNQSVVNQGVGIAVCVRCING